MINKHSDDKNHLTGVLFLIVVVLLLSIFTFLTASEGGMTLDDLLCATLITCEVIKE